jgi:hypothetical protein
MLGSAMLAFSSCETLVYTTASNVQPVSQAPQSLQEKGDMEVYGGIQAYNSINIFYDRPYDVDLLYVNMGMTGFDLSIDGALSDRHSLGLKYKFGKSYGSSGHGLTANFTHFKNYERVRETKRKIKNSQIGYDIKTGFAFENGPNIMSVDTAFVDLIAIDNHYYSFLILDSDFSAVAYYKLDHMDIKFFIQPSFSFTNRIFEFHIGGSMGYHYRHKYQPYFDYIVDPAISTAYHNPIVYYDQKKHFYFGEYFFTIGLGTEQIRVLWMAGGGRRTDAVQPAYRFFGLGIRGRF